MSRKTLKGLSHEMDLAFDDMLVVDLNRERGAIFGTFLRVSDLASDWL